MLYGHAFCKCDIPLKVIFSILILEKDVVGIR